MSELLNLTNYRKFNIFSFFSNLSIGMIEVYVPVLLYIRGFSFEHILLYFVIKYLVAIVIGEKGARLGNIIGFRELLLLGSVFFGITYYLILHFSFASDLFSMINLILISTSISLYSEFYWTGRRYFQYQVLPKKNIGDEIGGILIFSQLAAIIASYLGAVVLAGFGNNILLATVVGLMLISIVPLINFNDGHERKKLQGLDIIKDIPLASILSIGSRKFYSMTMHLFPLYLYLFISSDLVYIGIYNIVVGLASIVFIYFFSRKIDQDKNDYLIYSAFFLGLILLFRLELISTTAMLVLGLFEGIFKKMYEVSMERNECALERHYEPISYIIFINAIENFVQFIMYLIFFLFVHDIKIILVILIILVMFSGLIKFDDGKGGY